MTDYDATAPGRGEGTGPESDTVTAPAVARLHRLLDAPMDPPAAGDPLPPLWHWLAFLPDAAQRDLGSDGHPQVSTSYETGPFVRRMFAGGRLWFPGVARVGEELRRRTSVPTVTRKQGRTGELLFVTVRHRYEVKGTPVTVEEQDLVYRRPSTGTEQAASDETAPAGAPPGGGGQWTWSWEVLADMRMLFRFSALTYNAHRIHYDSEYAHEEGYPDLVVQGPLQAVALADLCRRHRGDRLRSFRFRARRPALVGRVLTFRGRRVSGGLELAAFDDHGRRTMDASVDD